MIYHITKRNTDNPVISVNDDPAPRQKLSKAEKARRKRARKQQRQSRKRNS